LFGPKIRFDLDIITKNVHYALQFDAVNRLITRLELFDEETTTTVE